MKSETEEEFRERVARLSTEDDFTKPEKGWPWPWEDSGTTDYSYHWTPEGPRAASFGKGYVTKEQIKANKLAWDEFNRVEDAPEPDELFPDDMDEVEYPDMSKRAAVTFGKRSGILILGLK